MDSILVLNVGSSSLRYHRYTAAHFELLHSGHIPFTTPLDSPAQFLKLFRHCLRDIGDITSIKVIGHRVVHGGDFFSAPVVIDDEIIEKLKSLNHLAPLHNPWNIVGIEASRSYLPHIPNVVVFDTAFFTSLPEVARIYAVPPEYAHYRRYGFHGISHSSVLERLSHKLKKNKNAVSCISCHLGGGCSVAAIENGQPIDVSMGFTPLEGCIMMTRSGDVDVGIVFDIIKNACAEANSVSDACNKVLKIERKFYTNAGMRGLTGRDTYIEILQSIREGNAQADLAFQIFIRRIRKYIGAFTALMKTLDAICFTGAIGAGDLVTRHAILNKLICVKGVKRFVFSSDEELTIAHEVKKYIN